MMYRLIPICLFVAFSSMILAQEPPPRLLPPSITGKDSAAEPVRPVTSVQPAAAPIARFQNLLEFPPETLQCVYSVRISTDWIARMNQANGRYLPGVNVKNQQLLERDPDIYQVEATLALADAARFAGDDRLTVRAVQSILALLSQTKPDPADATCRVPTMTTNNGVDYAAGLALAVYRLPNADASLREKADGLSAFLKKQVRSDGSIDALVRTNADQETTNRTIRWMLQLLAARGKKKADSDSTIYAKKLVEYYGQQFAAKPSAGFAASLITGTVDLALMNTQPDASLTPSIFAWADYLIQCQYTRADARSLAWTGGFKPEMGVSVAEPTFETAYCSEALAAATKLTRSVPDLNRFARYRVGSLYGLLFLHTIQFADSGPDPIPPAFRARFLVGGVRTQPSDPTVRLDTTAATLLAQLRFLESGGEGRPE